MLIRLSILSVVASGCVDDRPEDDGWADRCDSVIINAPTMDGTWTETGSRILIGGNVLHTSCDEPERAVEVRTANLTTGFEASTTATVECVQIFPTTGATQRNYYYTESVPLEAGRNQIEVRALTSCSQLEVSCAPCADPLPDAGAE